MRSRRRGASAVELALILPVLLSLLFGIIDWSLYMYEGMNVSVVANRGVRLAAGNEDPTAVALASMCEALLTHRMACEDGTVNAVVLDLPSGSVLEVTLSLPFDPAIGLIPTPGTLSARATTSWYGAVD